VTRVGERIWLVTFRHYFDDETCRLEPIQSKPLVPAVIRQFSGSPNSFCLYAAPSHAARRNTW
jgi:hypothetical protein